VTFAREAVQWLALGTLVFLTIAYALDYTRRRRGIERIGDAPQLRRMTASLSSRRRTIKAILHVTALTLIVAALARPQVEGESTWKKRGIDLVVAMDYSKSMLARDVYPSRAERMQLEVESLLDALESDRVATVAFAGAAAHFPLTHDTEAARSLFRGLSPLDMPPGSDLGEAIMISRCIVLPGVLDDPTCERVGGRGRGGAPLDEEPAPPPSAGELADRARAIVVFTDGEDTGDRAAQEVARAAQLGIHVYFVGVGTPSGELIPELDLEGNEVGWKKTPDGKSFVTTRLDLATLDELAAIAGGESQLYILAPDQAGAPDLLRQLRHLKKGDLDQRVIKTPVEVFQWFLFPALMLLLIEACISARRRTASPVDPGPRRQS
jgi:Ca-activated chloride channel homolog